MSLKINTNASLDDNSIVQRVIIDNLNVEQNVNINNSIYAKSSEDAAVIPMAAANKLGGITAENRTNESIPVKIDPQTGRLYTSIASTDFNVEITFTSSSFGAMGTCNKTLEEIYNAYQTKQNIIATVETNVYGGPIVIKHCNYEDNEYHIVFSANGLSLIEYISNDLFYGYTNTETGNDNWVLLSRRYPGISPDDASNNKKYYLSLNNTDNRADWTRINYSDIDNIPTVPTKTSELTNDSGFITSHQDISGKANLNGGNTLNGTQIINLGTEYGAKLEIKGSGNDQAIILTRTNGAQCVLEAGGTIGLFGTKTNHPIQVRTNYQNRMTIGTDGSIILATDVNSSSNDNQVATTKWVNSKLNEIQNTLNEILERLN